ncbi:MAG: ATP-binding cassette domain-containing protein [Acidobacteriota bacterium]|nr:ATP-binding cassette domain-containing protein [Acidobacteriota bacterium]
MPVLTLDHIAISFGRDPLLQDASLQVEEGERVAIIGRNGTGKSTLLKILSGELAPDAGAIWRAPGSEAARLAQDTAFGKADEPGRKAEEPLSVFDVVAGGLGALRDTVVAYHHAIHALTDDPSEKNLEVLGRAQHALEEQDGWSVEQRVELVLTRLELDADAHFDTLSGGWRRRVLLGRALVAQPALLLLDEPTNHLDVETIEWLEKFLLDYAGAIILVTHDRAFLQRLATRIVELDRGRLTSWPGDYRSYLEKRNALLENDVIANAKFDKLMAQEEVWLRRGVKARRTRDEGRVKALMAMREARAARRNEIGNVRIQIDSGDRSGQLVFEADAISKSYAGTPVVSDFSTRVMRGDRIGLIGPNGAGKTTLLRMLVGDLEPDAGTVRVGSNVQVAYFDQQREQLDPERTLVDTIGDGNDTVTVGGQPRHVHGYLEDFLFPPDRARSKVKALSGGERSRLLLARLFTRPANVLVLDEPTNDLDIETLELLESKLAEFAGTVLIVSHDREFLDNVVTSTLVFEGAGLIGEFVGGYEDWVRQRGATPPAAALRPSSAQAVKSPVAAAPAKTATPEGKPAPRPTPKSGSKSAKGKKLSFKEQRELESLPALIEALEAEERTLQVRAASPEFYKDGADAIKQTLARIEALGPERERALARWVELDERS